MTLTQLAKIAERLARHDTARADLVERRDNLIRVALAEGHRSHAVAEAARLSHVAVLAKRDLPLWRGRTNDDDAGEPK